MTRFLRKVNADGCHLGQNDMNIGDAKKILKKIIGVTCHNSIKLVKKLYLKKQAMWLLEHFIILKQGTFKANIDILKKIKNLLNSNSGNRRY